jgi:spore photoproduct lyase
MIDTIYVESDVTLHPRTLEILQRYPRARVIEIDNYRSIFNRRRQNFRVQKARPALIIANKSSPRLHDVPVDQHIGAPHNYYFSHLLNCPFDCRYCFLQGMFSSANYVLFVNYEDFVDDIRAVCAGHLGIVHLFSGYDCDSLAMEPLTQFAAYFLDAVKSIENAVLELRTKSTQIRTLLSRPAHTHCVIAMSLSPDPIAANVEHGAPSLRERLNALRRLQDHGWPIGLRFDPLIAIPDHSAVYEQFFDQVFSQLSADSVHSVTVGELRLPRQFAKRMFRLYPDEPLFAAKYNDIDGTFVFSGENNSGLLDSTLNLLQRYIAQEKIFNQTASIN